MTEESGTSVQGKEEPKRSVSDWVKATGIGIGVALIAALFISAFL